MERTPIIYQRHERPLAADGSVRPAVRAFYNIMLNADTHVGGFCLKKQ